MILNKELSELRKIAKAYSEASTFVFIEEAINEKNSYYNGYIISVKTDMIIFYDTLLKKEFPILLEHIKLIKPSRKEENGEKRFN